MKKLYFLSVLIILFFVSCKKNSDNNSILLNFTLDNCYVINNSDTVLTNNAYNLDTILFGNIYETGSLVLTDGVIGDTLRVGCSNWNYILNPTNTVDIWFPSSILADGIYNYSKESSTNDFEVRIKNNIVFDSTAWNRYNTIASYVGYSSINDFHTADPNEVLSAVLEIKNLENQYIEVKYHISTITKTSIKGCYLGSLEKYKFYHPESDCD